MPHIYKLRDDVRHLGQGPQGRMTLEKPTVRHTVSWLGPFDRKSPPATDPAD